MSALRVLIIDDDKETANLFRTVLSMVGFECEIILNARAAIARLASNVPDLILLDLHLGIDIGGEDILYMIRSNPRFASTRVVVITAFPSHAEMVTNLADMILLKPIEIGQLQNLVRRIGAYEVAPKRISFRDPITLLFDREFFITRIELAFERCKRRSDFFYGLIIFRFQMEDIDIAESDQEAWTGILYEIAGRLRKNLRATDTIARLSGYTFAILAEELKKPEDINAVLSRVKKELSEPYLVKQEAYRFEISYATMMQNPLYKEPRDILEAAERALAGA
ncbi:MAG: diguanylate cyclase domain-containing protein [Omnitrophica WOR_2 bacterium]